MASTATALQTYLLERTKNRQEVAAGLVALNSLVPFENINEKSGYPLGRASALNVGAFAAAMWTAFRRPVSRCAFLHAKVPLTEQPWPEGATRLDDLVVSSYADLCERSILFDRQFERAFADSVGDRLHAALSVTLAGTGLLAQSWHPSQMLSAVLRMRVALHAAQRPEAKNLDPLADILLRAIPMAGSVRKRGEWFAVVQ